MTALSLLLERLRTTFWALPALGITAATMAAIALRPLDDAVSLPAVLSVGGDADTARSTLGTITTVAVSVAGISFSVIVVALVLAAQQLSPRVLRGFQRHPLNQAVLGVFLGTAAFSLVTLGTMDQPKDPAPEIGLTISMLLGIVSLGTFVVFLHHVVRSLNASAVIRRIAVEGHAAVDGPYPAGVGAEPEDRGGAEAHVRRLTASLPRREVRAGRAGYLASVEAQGLLQAAERAGGLVEQRLCIGDFAVTGALLAVVWAPDHELDALEAAAHRAFVLNEERMVDGDVAFPLRQLADIALKGLSPSINDPTTAENAMDSATDTLVRVARQPSPVLLRAGTDGTPRLLTVTPDLDALVTLAFDQVRRDGASRPSFAVRLLELLAALRELGGERARTCEEIARQSRDLLDHAVVLAATPADAQVVREAHARLHGEP